MDAENVIQLRREHRSRFARGRSAPRLQLRPYYHNDQFERKMARAFNRKLQRLPGDEKLAGVLQRKTEYLEDELRAQKILYGAVRRQNASLKRELEILNNRVEFLYEWRRREGVKERTLGKKTNTKVTPSDLEWIRNTIGPKISKEEVVRIIRATRDAG